MTDAIPTDEARCKVLRVLYEMAVNDEAPASARDVAAMLQPHVVAYHQGLRCNEARIDAVQHAEWEQAEAFNT